MPKALPRALAVLALLLACPVFGVEIERVPELAPISPVTPVVTPALAPLETPQLGLEQLEGIPTLQPISALAPAQTATAQATAEAAKPGALASVQNLSAAMATPKASDSSRQANLTATFDAAKSGSGGGAVAVGDGEGGEGNGGGAGGGGGNPSRGKDDGGGPAYPVRMIRALGTTFRSVLFRPNFPVEAEIVRAIDQTQKGDKIRISIYEFGNGKTLDALRKARSRKVDIKIILDYANVFPETKTGGYTPKVSKEIWSLLREGFEVQALKGLGEYGIAHNKICVIQSTRGSLGIFGSYNWKWTAEQDHYENANFTSDRKRIEGLYSYWNWLSGLSAKVVYDHADGSIDLANPNWEWPKTVPAPPQFARSIDFNGVDLPFLVVSPASEGGASAEDELVSAYDAAKKSIQVSIFALRSTKIVEALRRAKEERKLKTVQVIIDKGQAQSDAFKAYADYLAYHGIEVKVLAGPDPTADFQLSQKDHHKFSLLDGKLVEVGSFNYTKYAAIGNFENAHFLDDETDAKSYAFMFKHMWERADDHPAPAAEPRIPTDEQLVKEVFPSETAPTPTDPAPVPDGPLPSWPRPTAGSVAFNGETYKAVMTKPDDAISPELARLIKGARKSIRLSAYEFNLPDLLESLRWVRANKPKVKIEIVLDRSHVYTSGRDHTGGPRKPSPEITALIREGFDVLILKGDHSGIMHSKYLLIDAPAQNVGARLAKAAQKLSIQAFSGLASAFNSPLFAGLAQTQAAKVQSDDEQTGLVARGSYNFAVTAENNHYENIALTIEKDRVQNYLNDFKYKRGLAEEVDHDKLDEILSRTELPTRKGSSRQSDDGDNETEAFDDVQAHPDMAGMDAAEIEAARKPPLPPPPPARGMEVDINGEKFHTEYFSPNGGIMDAWLRGIKAAEKSLDVAMFGFYSRDVAEALVAAATGQVVTDKETPVHIQTLVAAIAAKRKTNKDFRLRMVLDAGQASLARFDRVPGDRTSGTRVSDWLKARGIDVKLNGGPHWRSKTDPRDPMFEKMHSKYMIIDGKWIFTGSWNASDRAEEDNFENMTVLLDPADVAMIVWDFERMYLRSLAPGEREPVDTGTGASLPGL